VSDYYLRSSDGDDGYAGTPGAPFATLVGALAVMAAGDRCYVSDLHDETLADDMYLAGSGTAASPCQTMCIDDWGTETDPGSITHTASTGASIATITSNGNIVYFRRFHFFQGIDFGSLFQFVFLDDAYAGRVAFRQCSLTATQYSNACVFHMGIASHGRAQAVEFIDTDLSATNGGVQIKPLCRFDWRNGSLTQGKTSYTPLFYGAGSGAPGIVTCESVDLSQVDTITNASLLRFEQIHLHRCLLKSGSALASNTFPMLGAEIRSVECDHGTNFIRQAKHDYNGVVSEDTVRVRDNSESSYSHKLVSSGYTQFYSPLRSFPIGRYNATEGSSVTVRVEMLIDGVTLTNGDAWIEVNYLGSASYPLGAIASSAKGNILATASSHTTSSEGWTTTGLTSPVKQYTEVTFTPQEAGLVEIVFCLAKVSTTVYVDPDVEVN